MTQKEEKEIIQEWVDEDGAVVAQLLANVVLPTVKKPLQRVTDTDAVQTKSDYEFVVKATTVSIEVELLEPLTANDGQVSAI